MKTVRRTAWLPMIVCLAVSLASRTTQAQNHQFQVTSSTFADGTTLPISAIHNFIVNNVNVCSVDGSVGGNQSPELAWTNVPAGTQTFAMVAYDRTAAFTHWGMYNIPATTTELPANAGAPGSSFGTQVINDNFAAAQYDGPCPPANVAPDVHHYVFTVYALDKTLTLPGSRNFPPIGETLYQALISAGMRCHILATAKITGLYSTTPGK
jgi:Raf kinase inhibitor-like YbhB/YbcL family protein